MLDWSTILMIALMGGAVYFLMIRPQQKRAKDQANLMSALEPGSRVMTISGIVGNIKYLGDKQAILEVSPGVEITIDKRALSTQPVIDEFEYADDLEPQLIAHDAPLALTPDVTATDAAEPVPALDAVEPAVEPTDGPTWDNPGSSKN
ncbi:MAG: preprotein translocase subunit YajC [Propionicimonas sp.]